MKNNPAPDHNVTLTPRGKTLRHRMFYGPVLGLVFIALVFGIVSIITTKSNASRPVKYFSQPQIVVNGQVPTPMKSVPSTIPPNGVLISGAAWVLEPASDPPADITSTQAVNDAWNYIERNYPTNPNPNILFASVTLPYVQSDGTLVGVAGAPVSGVPTWVLTFAIPPETLPLSAPPCLPVQKNCAFVKYPIVSHEAMLIDALTGKMYAEAYTP